MSKKLLVTKTFYFALYTLLSRFLGFARELIKAKCLGVGALSDAFLTVFRLPNALYKIFAEGVISSALVPYATKLMQEKDVQSVHKLLTLCFLSILFFFFILSVIMLCAAPWCLWCIAPGWFATGQTAFIVQSCSMLRILMFSMLFLAGSSFLSGALHIHNNFSLSSMQPVCMNVLLITQFLYIYFSHFSLEMLAWLYLLNSLLIFLMSLMTYRLHLPFVWPFEKQTYQHAQQLLLKLVPAFINVGILEINTVVDTVFASYYSNGFMSLLNHSGAFLRVPLGIFATSFATILLPYLSKLTIHSPRRLHYHLHESIKALLWLTLPATFLLLFFSRDIFATIFPRITVGQLDLAQQIVIACGSGLFFFSLNRVLLAIYYALGETKLPTYLSLINVLLNIAGNFLFTLLWGPVGIVWATTISSCVQTVLLLVFLVYKFNFVVYGKRLSNFFLKMATQHILLGGIFVGIYNFLRFAVARLLPSKLFFLHQIGLWLWVGPLVMLAVAALWLSRKKFNVNIYYFD